MKSYTLKCFESFRCTAEKCSDNCCIGWGIDIDEKTVEYYRALEGEFGAFVKENIDFEKSCIKMGKNGRCPFLNESNLCDIIIRLGEEHISYICTNHPRFFNVFGTHTETGFGLCCEEAARLLFEKEVLLEEIPDKNIPLFALREGLFGIIRDKTFSLKEKIYYFLDLICEADDILFQENDEEILSLADNYKYEKKEIKNAETAGFLETAQNTEPIDEIWERKLAAVTEHYKEIQKNLSRVININKSRYEKLFYYYTFRYLLKDIYEREIVSKGKLIIFLLYLNIIFDTYSYLEKSDDYLKNTILISKQMEYSEENLEFILNEALCNNTFDFENITGI